MSNVVQCPYKQWFRFRKCTIKTCKNWNKMTKHRCLAIDRIRAEGTKVISDAEIHLYKFKDMGVTSRLVQLRRSAACYKISSILILNAFIEHIKSNKQPGAVFKSDTITKLESEYPLKISILGWENWMWEYLVDETEWKKFCEIKGVQYDEYPQYKVLDCKISTYEQLVKTFM